MKTRLLFSAFAILFFTGCLVGYLLFNAAPKIQLHAASTFATANISDAKLATTLGLQQEAVINTQANAAKTAVISSNRNSQNNSSAIKSVENKSSVTSTDKSNRTPEAEKAGANKEFQPIGNEEARKIIPAPFNYALTIFKDNDRKTYKLFADTELSDDWDLNTQGKLIDAIYSSPYASALTLDSVSCKAHICELRIFATNNTAWPKIYGEMSTQPWWEFGNNFSVYEFSMRDETHVKFIYFVLLVRK